MRSFLKKIIGAWDARKHVTYFPDKIWMLQKYVGDTAAAGNLQMVNPRQSARAFSKT
jgi:hypothetical protein